MSHIPHNRVKPNQKVDLWDLGPQNADGPQPPEKPDAKLKGAELAAAEVEYEDAMLVYKDQLRAWSASRKDKRDWDDKNGGPRKIELWAADARHAMEVDPKRYVLDLPKGQKPGKAQVEAEEAAAKEQEALERDVAADPQFGSKGA